MICLFFELSCKYIVKKLNLLLFTFYLFNIIYNITICTSIATKISCSQLVLTYRPIGYGNTPRALIKLILLDDSVL